MAIDIQLIKSGDPVHNGSVVVTCSRTGKYSLIEEDAITIPDISTLESKYDDRFDDPSYYYGGGLSDGGIYTGDVLGI